MKKILLAFSAVLVLASFNSSTNKTITLIDIDGTLLQSNPVIETIDGNYTITFEVNANTIVISNVDKGLTHINLVENGSSNKVVAHSIAFNTKGVDFNSYFESSFDVASTEEAMSGRRTKKGKPKKLME